MSTPFPDALHSVLQGGTLPLHRARLALGAVIDGGATAAQAGAFLGALALRGPAADELVGFGQALRERCVRVKVNRTPLLDTGGNSTAVAFIAAGAGAAVAEQVGRGLCWRPGLAEVLDILGVRLDDSPEDSRRCVEATGICFLPQQAFHPTLERVSPLRQDLGVRTVFDLLTPLAHPAGAGRQLLGVPAAPLVPLLARALKSLGSESAMVVSSRDGLCGFSLAAPTVVAHLRAGRIEEYEVDAAALGLQRRPAADCVSRSPAAEAALVLATLKGERGPAYDAALLNAAAALIVADRASDFKEGLARAAESIDSCRALQTLEAVKKLGRT